MRVYLTEKVIFTEATRVDKSLCLPKLKSIAVLLYDFSTMNKKFLYSFTFVVEAMFNLSTFSKVLATVIKSI